MITPDCLQPDLTQEQTAAQYASDASPSLMYNCVMISAAQAYMVRVPVEFRHEREKLRCQLPDLIHLNSLPRRETRLTVVDLL